MIQLTARSITQNICRTLAISQLHNSKYTGVKTRKKSKLDDDLFTKSDFFSDDYIENYETQDKSENHRVSETFRGMPSGIDPHILGLTTDRTGLSQIETHEYANEKLSNVNVLSLRRKELITMNHFASVPERLSPARKTFLEKNSRTLIVRLNDVNVANKHEFLAQTFDFIARTEKLHRTNESDNLKDSMDQSVGLEKEIADLLYWEIKDCPDKVGHLTNFEAHTLVILKTKSGHKILEELVNLAKQRHPDDNFPDVLRYLQHVVEKNPSWLCAHNYGNYTIRHLLEVYPEQYAPIISKEIMKDSSKTWFNAKSKTCKFVLMDLFELDGKYADEFLRIMQSFVHIRKHTWGNSAYRDVFGDLGCDEHGNLVMSSAMKNCTNDYLKRATAKAISKYASKIRKTKHGLIFLENIRRPVNPYRNSEYSELHPFELANKLKQTRKKGEVDNNTMILYFYDVCIQYELEGQPDITQDDLEDSAAILSNEFHQKSMMTSQLFIQAAKRQNKRFGESFVIELICKTKLGSVIMSMILDDTKLNASTHFEKYLVLHIANRSDILMQNLYGTKVIQGVIARSCEDTVDSKTNKLLKNIGDNVWKYATENKYACGTLQKLVAHDKRIANVIFTSSFKTDDDDSWLDRSSSNRALRAKLMDFCDNKLSVYLVPGLIEWANSRPDIRKILTDPVFVAEIVNKKYGSHAAKYILKKIAKDEKQLVKIYEKMIGFEDDACLVEEGVSRLENLTSTTKLATDQHSNYVLLDLIKSSKNIQNRVVRDLISSTHFLDILKSKFSMEICRYLLNHNEQFQTHFIREVSELPNLIIPTTVGSVLVREYLDNFPEKSYELYKIIESTECSFTGLSVNYSSVQQVNVLVKIIQICEQSRGDLMRFIKGNLEVLDFGGARLEDGACILLSEFVNLGEGEQVLELVGRFNINFDYLRKNEVYL